MICGATEHPNVVQYIASYYCPGAGNSEAEVNNSDKRLGRLGRPARMTDSDFRVGRLGWLAQMKRAWFVSKLWRPPR